ncbi:MAG TPA: hypothetical protein VLJ42_00440 [Solirubrobacteraceae bacterium]|nr:hypothetical protein [Solirubrobacteraceae bacterium]
MTGQSLGLALSVFLACAVEAVEALTIVLAMGLTRGWRSSLAGMGAALMLLTALVAALGPTLLSVPLDVLRLVVGGLLLVFGLQWLSKAILRAAGLKARHDEAEAFTRETSAARAHAMARRDSQLDGYAFTVAFKGVLLEGLEVVFVVLTFGANQHHVGLAAASAGAALALVTVVGMAARAPLARVPENAMKFGVGVMLTAFGVFWSTEGAGASWPGDDAALLVLIPATLIAGLGIAWVLRERAAARYEPSPALHEPPPAPVAPLLDAPAPRRHAEQTPRGNVERGVRGVWGFFVGKDWRAALGVLLALSLSSLLAGADVAAWWPVPLAVLALLSRPLLRRA